MTLLLIYWEKHSDWMEEEPRFDESFPLFISQHSQLLQL